jgi:hypothetical protein
MFLLVWVNFVHINNNLIFFVAIVVAPDAVQDIDGGS